MRHELTIVSVLLSFAALATAQASPTPAELVERLAVADQRANAREQSDPPKGHFVRWNEGGSVTSGEVDRTAVVQRLAAQAIVAIAATDDPLVIAARDVLARPEPK